MRDRIPEGLGSLTREGAATGVGDGPRDHDRNPEPGGGEVRVDGEQRGLRIERVEDGLNQQEVGSPLQQPANRLAVGRDQLIEADVPKAGVVHIG